MQDYKISIIVPIFNSQDYLGNCIGSVINQSIGFENLELILIDDKSTDDSRNIILSYADKYENIVPVLFERNTGSASCPRNKGIDISSAPFIIFLDSDDELYGDYCEVLYNAISSNDVDIVNCDRTSKLNNDLLISKDIESINSYQKVLDKNEQIFLEHTVWGNIYRSSFLKDNNIKFFDMLYEDLVFSVNCIVKTDKEVISLSNYPGYIYFIENEKSVTHKVSIKTLNDFLKCITLIYNFIKQKYSAEIISALLNDLFKMGFFILSKLDNPLEGIEIFYEFEKEFPISLNPNFKPFAVINNQILNKKFKMALISLKLMGVLYNNDSIRHFLFINYSNLKMIEQ